MPSAGKTHNGYGHPESSGRMNGQCCEFALQYPLARCLYHADEERIAMRANVQQHLDLLRFHGCAGSQVKIDAIAFLGPANGFIGNSCVQNGVAQQVIEGHLCKSLKRVPHATDHATIKMAHCFRLQVLTRGKRACIHDGKIQLPFVQCIDKRLTRATAHQQSQLREMLHGMLH